MRSRRCDSISRTASRITSCGKNVPSDRSSTKRYPLTRDSPVSLSSTATPFRRINQAADFFGERAPVRLHVGQTLQAELRQAIVLARVRRFILDPRGLEQPLARQPAEDRVDRAFGDDEIGEVFEMLDEREAVARAGGDGQEDREVEPAAPKLFLPGVERHTLCHKALTRRRGKKFRGAPAAMPRRGQVK